MVLVDKLPLTF